MRVLPVLLLPVFLLPAAPRAGHPRVFLRAKGSPGIPGLDEIRARAERPPWSARLPGLAATTHGKALHWLITGDEASARACLEDLRRTNPDEGYGLTAQGPLFTLPVAYDWLRSWPGFTEADRREVEAKIVTTADRSVAFLAGRSDSVWHTSAPRSLMGVALAAAALDGPKGGEYLAFAREYYERTFGPAQAALDGGAVAGMSYGVDEGFAPLSYALFALKTARGLDYHAGNAWLRRRAEYMAHQLLPDLTFGRWGDVVTGSRCSLRDEGRNVIDMLARATGSPTARWLSRRAAEKWPGRQAYHDCVLPDFFVFGEEPPDVAPDAPLVELFGEAQIGQCFFRTGWGPDDTVVFVKAGDYFDNHGHPDQGSFTIYRRGHLAIDSGVYDTYGSPHHKGYAATTVAHNVVLFGTDAGGGQRAPNRQDSQDLAEHEARKRSLGFETGDVIGFASAPDHAYFAADLAAACDAKVVSRWTRELVWLSGPGALVVFDRTASSRPPRWLLHGVNDPEIEGSRWTFALPASRLVGFTLLPAGAAVRKVGPGCIVDGRDVPPASAGEFGVPGAWRVEVSGGPVFLHVIFALDAGAATPKAKLVEQGALVGVEVAGKTVLFRREGPTQRAVVR